MRVYQLDPKTGVKRYPAQQSGNYVLGDYKKYGARQHIAGNKVFVRTEAEMIALIKDGHYVWVESSPRPSLVRLHLYIDGTKFT